MAVKQFNRTTQAYLIVGSGLQVQEAAITLCQELFCQTACQQCTSCKQLQNRQHYGLLWLQPDGQYTTEQVASILAYTSLMLDQGEYRVLVFEQADLMTEAAANRLLKTVEEPPQGYIFLFLSSRMQEIIPTIRSRCVIINLIATPAQQQRSTFLPFFMQQEAHPIEFLAALDKELPTEQNARALLDDLMAVLLEEEKQAPTAITAQRLTLVEQAYTMLPMPGSTKLFLKNLFLQYHTTVS